MDLRRPRNRFPTTDAAAEAFDALGRSQLLAAFDALGTGPPRRRADCDPDLRRDDGFIDDRVRSNDVTSFPEQSPAVVS